MPLALEPGLHPGGTSALGWLALGAVLLGAVAALTHQHGRAWTASLLYVAAGLLLATGLEALDVRWLDPLAHPDAIARVCELVLVVALFANGVRLDRELSPAQWRATARLLLVAMPLSIAAVALLGAGLLGLSTGAAIVLGAALAPTDPVLAGDVGETAPGEHEPDAEFAITSEASLNDGLAAPFLVLGLLAATGDLGDAGSWASWVGIDLVLRCVLGLAAGVVVGAAAGAVAPGLRDRGYVTTAYDGILTAGLALVSFGAGEVLGGYGFLSAFAAGVAFRRREAGHATHEEVHEGAGRLERLLELVVLLLVATSATTALLHEPGVEGWLLVVLTALVVRPVAGWISLAGSPLRSARERAYVAWFGVRGVGTLFYAAIAVAGGELSDGESAVIWWTAVAAVLASIVVHGLSSGPATRALNARR